MDDERVHPFWLRNDRDGYIEQAQKVLTLALQAGSSSPQITEPVEGGASAISIAFFLAASMAKSLPLNFPTRWTWVA